MPTLFESYFMQPSDPEEYYDIEHVYGKKKKRGMPDYEESVPRRVWCLFIVVGLGCIGMLLLGFAIGFWLSDESNNEQEQTRVAGLTQTALNSPIPTLGTPIFITPTTIHAPRPQPSPVLERSFLLIPPLLRHHPALLISR